MVTDATSRAPHRTISYLAACAAVILTASAVCCPNPAPAAQGDEPPQPEASRPAEEGAEANPPIEDAVASEPGQEAPEPSIQPEPQTPAETPAQPELQAPAEAPAEPDPEASPEATAPPASASNQPEAAEPVPDKSRALETGVPVSNGISANPASVILDVATAMELAGVSPEVLGVDTSTGRVLYASEA